MADEKVCTKCGASKPADHQHFAKGRRGGLSSWCRTCQNAVNKAWRSNPEVKAAEAEKRRKRYGWKKKGPPKGRAKRDHAADYARYRDKREAWKRANPEKVKAAQARANLKRRSTPEGRLNHRVSENMRQHLQQVGVSKAGRRWEQMVGYTVEDLRRHLERQFTPGMGWDNFGDWHIDHVVPASSFTFTGPDDAEFRACWALTNLRPMWGPDNVRKRDKRIHLI